MTSPYRNDLHALSERKADLEREIARLREQTSALEGLRGQQEELARELAVVERRMADGGAKRTLPLLERVTVASPCPANWDEMLGDDRVRFCVSCEKNVYNLSAMPREEAEQLLRERLGNNLCVRYYQRADGTILTEDCPIGVTKKRRKKVALAVAAAGATAFAAAQFLTARTIQGVTAPTQGEPMVQDTAATTVTPTPPLVDVPVVDKGIKHPVMGGLRPIQPPPTQVRPEPKSSPVKRMGRVATPPGFGE